MLSRSRENAKFMRVVFFIMRLVLLVAGALFTLSLLVAGLLLMLLWALRSLWARLTDQPVTPFVMKINRGAGFGQAFRSRHGVRPRNDGAPAADARRDRLSDIEDVEVKPPRE